MCACYAYIYKQPTDTSIIYQKNRQLKLITVHCELNEEPFSRYNKNSSQISNGAWWGCSFFEEVTFRVSVCWVVSCWEIYSPKLDPPNTCMHQIPRLVPRQNYFWTAGLPKSLHAILLAGRNTRGWGARFRCKCICIRLHRRRREIRQGKRLNVTHSVNGRERERNGCGCCWYYLGGHCHCCFSLICACFSTGISRCLHDFILSLPALPTPPLVYLSGWV